MTTKTAAAALHMLLIPVLGLAFLLTALTQTAPEGGWVGSDAIVAAQKPHNVPAWTPAMADTFPACESFREGVLAAEVVVVDQTGTALRLTVDAAMARATDDKPANDLWVVGICLPTRSA